MLRKLPQALWKSKYRKLTLALPTALVASAFIVSTALGAATVNSDGTGFVPKGDVQTAFSWNNSDLQKKASGVTFTIKQAAEQAMSQTATQTATQAGTQTGTQSGTQAGTQSGTQIVSQDVTCT